MIDPDRMIFCIKCGESELEIDNLYDGLCARCYIRHLEGRVAGLSGALRQLREKTGLTDRV